MIGRLLRIRPNARRDSASPFHLFKCSCVERVQFFVVQAFDGTTQVLGQDMPLGYRFGCRLWGRW